MTRELMKTIRLRLAILGLFAIVPTSAQATNLLSNGDLELFNFPPGWTLLRSVTDLPGANVNSASLTTGAFAQAPDDPGGQGLWLRAFVGNAAPYAGQNRKTNAELSQAVPAVPGESYTLTGWAKFEQNYSGGVTQLDPLSPTGQAGGDLTSPTQSIWEMAFLDADSNVVGTPVTLDLRSTGQVGDNTYYQHTLMGTAPTGTASVRVTAKAIDMITNINPQQSGAYDNFSLKAASAPAVELLTNGSLNAPAVTPGWTLLRSPRDNVAQVEPSTFANHTEGGISGFWLRAFSETLPSVGDASITQTVPGIAGGNYTFSAWSKWEVNYSGAIQGSQTETFMELAFLDTSSAVIGTPLTLDLRNEQTNDNTWRQHFLGGVAPEGTVSVRVTAGARGMFNNPGASQSAMFDDFVLTLAAGLTGDYNGDGRVDASDYVVWRKTGINGQQGYDDWRANFGAQAGHGSVGNSTAVPEPASSLFVVSGFVAGLGMCRRRTICWWTRQRPGGR